MLPKTILDTDIFILSALMRRNPQAIARSREYLSEYPQLSFSIVTRYEILRGLKAKGAIQRSNEFDQFCATCEVLPLSEEIVARATDIYAGLWQRGNLIGDADILIAATAIERGWTLATNNQAHFARVIELVLDNWL
jgi:tRNA(fMet)-specific endonuclease VapC